MSYPISTINGKEYKVVYGFHFNAKTEDKIIDILVSAFTMKRRIRIHYGDVTTGKSWMEEYDTNGYIGRSTGSIKIPLLVNTKRSMGEGGLLTDCIIAIQVRAGLFLYKHPLFNVGNLQGTNVSDLPDYKSMVTQDGEVVARFKHISGAERYVKFMKGERLCK